MRIVVTFVEQFPWISPALVPYASQSRDFDRVIRGSPQLADARRLVAWTKK